ncbi:saccharopine dehydrogenase-like oxidoreductase [Trichoplusia ni]|uniref:Saccharopine dehydrogenase-like oxidoreductase n=1 Tax=Trichoplusia ni TaxID=7111 RepID=A0A7E5VSQ4_TRINI|nr:saccharopine dehydrogenase-like oxidoreductase [Trichoplusia ni]
MSRLDLVIFGATGFTGKQAVIHMVKFAKKYNIGAWGVAGRSESKLNALMSEVATKTGSDVSGVKIFIADVGDEKSLRDMCAQTKLVVNCCGPYRMYGEPVVKAAVENKANYVDVSGEPQFMETMQLRYDAAARDAGVFVVSACGWDSVPADMGVVFLKQHFDGTLNSVESYLDSYLAPEYAAESKERGIINYGTWESLVYGIAHHNELPALRKQLYTEPLPRCEPKLKRQSLQKVGSSWFLPFPGADESVVYRSQRHDYAQAQTRPTQFRAYFKAGSFPKAILTIFGAILLFLMTKTKFTRNILLQYPKLCSLGMVTKQGPSDNVMNNTHFTFDLVGRGWPTGADIQNTEPSKKIVGRVSGTNPGYGATVVALLMSATTLLQEREKLPGPGGVLTPGAVFKNTSLIQKLIENDLKYEIIENK